MGYKKFWNEEIETLPKEKLKKLQLKRLKRVVELAYNKSPFYRKLYDEAKVKPSDIKHLEDIKKLPLIDKKKVVSAYPFDLIITDKKNLVELHSGTLPNKNILPVFATREDLSMWAELNARSLWMVGLRPKDKILNAFRFGLSTGGFGFHYGASKIGAISIPASVGRTLFQIQLILDLKVDAVCMMPSYAVHLGLTAKEIGIDLKEESNLRIGLFGAEPFSYNTRRKIEELLGLTAYDEYGMNEFLGPGMACECEERKGLHIWADAFLVECINPRTNEWVEEGEEGELVWTWLTSTGTAMIRYRSHDISFITWEKCSCGRTHPKMSAKISRSDNALCIGGYVVYPEKIYDLLREIPDIGFFQIIIETKKALDVLTLKIEVVDAQILKNQYFSQKLISKIKSIISNYIGVKPEIILCEPFSISGKFAEKKIPYIVLDYRIDSGKYGIKAEEEFERREK